jgi:hypothetical protein
MSPLDLSEEHAKALGPSMKRPRQAKPPRGSVGMTKGTEPSGFVQADLSDVSPSVKRIFRY